MSLLPATSYQPPQVGRSQSSNVIAPKNRSKPAHVQLPEASDVEDDEPTPRVVDGNRDSVSSFNSLYDVSDDESVMVPIRISNSIKKNLNVKPRSKAPCVPPLVIPTSPSGWPSIQKLKAAQAARATAGGKMTPLSPHALLQLATQTTQAPNKSATPSLAESFTSDELASMSPNTPASALPDDQEQWDMPVQLHPQALSTLQQISYEDATADEQCFSGLTPQYAGEMQDRGLNINIIFDNRDLALEEPCSSIEPLSAISVPSPGGFFASLTSPVKDMWSSSRSEEPSTSTAEYFYNAPFERSGTDIVERIITVPQETASGPPTARRDLASTPIVDELVIPADRVYEYDSNYEANLAQAASNNISRTSLWLNTQSSYLGPLSNDHSRSPTSDRSKSTSTTVPPSHLPGPPPQRALPPTQHLPSPPPLPSKRAADSLFYHAFQHFLLTTPTATAFTQRHLRLDALTTQRRFLHNQHLRQLTSAFTLPACPQPSRLQGSPATLPETPAASKMEAKRLACAIADRERSAQTQIQLNVWTLQAARFLAQGRLLPSVADKALASSAKPKVLDLGGQPTADWAWALAWESRDVSVITAVVAASSGDVKSWESHKGPSNHRIVSVESPWSLPFADREFDVVSARTLHTLLKIQGSGPFGDAEGKDEWALTLKEILRVLKPGGILSYETLDASILPLPLPVPALLPNAACGVVKDVPAPLAARASSFVSLLTTLRYDPIPSVSNVARLEKAGFRGAKEQVIVNLALSSKSDSKQGVEALTGMVGSVMWERWMAATQREAGVGQARILDGVAGAFEAASREAEGRWGWRVGRGWCRK